MLAHIFVFIIWTWATSFGQQSLLTLRRCCGSYFDDTTWCPVGYVIRIDDAFDGSSVCTPTAPDVCCVDLKNDCRNSLRDMTQVRLCINRTSCPELQACPNNASVSCYVFRSEPRVGGAYMEVQYYCDPIISTNAPTQPTTSNMTQFMTSSTMRSVTPLSVISQPTTSNMTQSMTSSTTKSVTPLSVTSQPTTSNMTQFMTSSTTKLVTPLSVVSQPTTSTMTQSLTASTTRSMTPLSIASQPTTLTMTQSMPSNTTMLVTPLSVTSSMTPKRATTKRTTVTTSVTPVMTSSSSEQATEIPADATVTSSPQTTVPTSTATAPWTSSATSSNSTTLMTTQNVQQNIFDNEGSTAFMSNSSQVAVAGQDNKPLIIGVVVGVGGGLLVLTVIIIIIVTCKKRKNRRQAGTEVIWNGTSRQKDMEVQYITVKPVPGYTGTASRHPLSDLDKTTSYGPQAVQYVSVDWPRENDVTEHADLAETTSFGYASIQRNPKPSAKQSKEYAYANAQLKPSEQLSIADSANTTADNSHYSNTSSVYANVKDLHSTHPVPSTNTKEALYSNANQKSTKRTPKSGDSAEMIYKNTGDTSGKDNSLYANHGEGLESRDLQQSTSYVDVDTLYAKINKQKKNNVASKLST